MAGATLGCMSQYANSTHAELWLRAKAEAGALRQSADVQDLVLAKRPTTHWQRQQIRAAMAPGADRSLADLLDALARQVHHGEHLEGDAAQQLLEPGTTLLTVFGPRLANRQRNARHQVVLEAANLVLRTRAKEWLNAGKPGETRHDRAIASNRGLAAVLGELEAERKRYSAHANRSSWAGSAGARGGSGSEAGAVARTRAR